MLQLQGILGRNPVLSVLLFAAVGLAGGLGLSFWEPDDPETKDKALKWLGLIGDLFIRSLKCVVLPLVFVNVIISVVDMMNVGKASSVGWITIGLYLATTVCAAIIGIMTTLALKGLYNEGEFTEAGPALVSLGCNVDGTFLTEGTDGSLSCSADAASEMDTQFAITDLTKTFSRVSSGAANDISLSDTIYDGVFTKLVTDNIVGSFAGANFAAVVFFAIAFGVALAKVMEKRTTKSDMSFIMSFLKELDCVCLLLSIGSSCAHPVSYLAAWRFAYPPMTLILISPSLYKLCFPLFYSCCPFSHSQGRWWTG